MVWSAVPKMLPLFVCFSEVFSDGQIFSLFWVLLQPSLYAPLQLKTYASCLLGLQAGGTSLMWCNIQKDKTVKLTETERLFLWAQFYLFYFELQIAIRTTWNMRWFQTCSPCLHLTGQKQHYHFSTTNKTKRRTLSCCRLIDVWMLKLTGQQNRHEPKQTTCAGDHIPFLLHKIACMSVPSTEWMGRPLFIVTHYKMYIDACFSIYMLDDT